MAKVTVCPACNKLVALPTQDWEEHVSKMFVCPACTKLFKISAAVDMTTKHENTTPVTIQETV